MVWPTTFVASAFQAYLAGDDVIDLGGNQVVDRLSNSVIPNVTLAATSAVDLQVLCCPRTVLPENTLSRDAAVCFRIT